MSYIPPPNEDHPVKILTFAKKRIDQINTLKLMNVPFLLKIQITIILALLHLKVDVSGKFTILIYRLLLYTEII